MKAHCVRIGGFCLFMFGLLFGEQRTYVFSDVRHVVEVDDYVGTEIVLRIDPSSNKIAGQWDLYEGYDALVTPMQGTLSGSLVKMSGADTHGRAVTFTAALSEKSLRGTLKWYAGNNLQTRRVRLHRVFGRLEASRRQQAR
jgi:hypothetical protein